MPAPVSLFVYNRPWHTQQTVEALKKNLLADKTVLYVFSDGGKSDADASKVNEVRSFFKGLSGFSAIHLTESPQNQGLAQAIINGVSEVVSRNEKVIVLEDDMITSPYFLTYMNEALDLYETTEEVISIHGYIYPVRQPLPETFFLKGADCWGWATWKRGWNLFESDGKMLLEKLNEKNLTTEFDFSGSYPYTRMLKNQIKGKNSSWAIRWYASAFLKDKVTLYPGRSLVKNIGNDTSGTHSWDNDRFDQDVLDRPVQLQQLNPEENSPAKDIICGYLKSTEPSLLKKLINRLKFKLK